MKPTLIAIVSCLLATAAGGRPAYPLAAEPLREQGVAVRSALLVPVRSHRQYSEQSAGAGVIKPGAWQFNAELQSAVSPAGGQGAQSDAGFQAPYMICVDARRPVPSLLGPRCKLDQVARQEGNITWSMTCTNPEGAVHSDGVAQYHGDTMEASVVSHLPNAAGKLTDISQRITGHYLGACSQTAAGGAAPAPEAAAGPEMAAAPVEPPRINAGTPNDVPPANSGTAAPPAAAVTSPPETAAPPETYHRRYAYHRRYYRRHYRYYRAATPFPFSLIFGR